MLWIMIATFILTVVASAAIALEYARIDSIAVDYKVEEFEHAVGSSRAHRSRADELDCARGRG